MSIRKIIKEEAAKKGMTLSPQEEQVILEGLLDKIRSFLGGGTPSTLEPPQAWRERSAAAKKRGEELARARSRGREIGREIPHASTFIEPEAQVTYGGISLLLGNPELVKRIWKRKTLPQQQKDFFIAVLSNDPEALDYFKSELDHVLYTPEQSHLTETEARKVLEALIQIQKSVSLDEDYIDFFKVASGIKTSAREPISRSPASSTAFALFTISPATEEIWPILRNQDETAKDKFFSIVLTPGTTETLNLKGKDLNRQQLVQRFKTDVDSYLDNLQRFLQPSEIGKLTHGKGKSTLASTLGNLANALHSVKDMAPDAMPNHTEENVQNLISTLRRERFIDEAIKRLLKRK